jgi:hypothetical protein
MNLAKALKVKNKKLAEYNKTLQKVMAYNSYDVTSKKDYNAKTLLDLAETQLQEYVLFKTAIHTASQPVRDKIFLIGELKSLLNRIQNLSTTEGVYKDRYAPEGSTFACDINQLEKDAKIEALEAGIEKLQDELDYFNATTEI